MGGDAGVCMLACIKGRPTLLTFIIMHLLVVNNDECCWSVGE